MQGEVAIWDHMRARQGDGTHTNGEILTRPRMAVPQVAECFSACTVYEKKKEKRLRHEVAWSAVFSVSLAATALFDLYVFSRLLPAESSS